MPGMARTGDSVSTEEGNGTITGGSSNVFINGLPAARMGDSISVDNGTIVSGFPLVLINGIPAAVLGSITDPEGTVTSASSNVFLG